MSQGSRKSTDLQIQYAIIDERIKLRSLKNKIFFSHPNDHRTQPAGSAICNVAQNVVTQPTPIPFFFLFSCKGVLVLHVQLFVSQDFQVFFCRDSFQPISPQAGPIKSYSSPATGLCISLHWTSHSLCQQYSSTV